MDFSQIPLRDVHLPGAVSWWPPAIGWWLIAACLIAGAALWAFRFHRLYRKRVALRVLRKVLSSLETGAEPVRCLQRVSSILRRFAMTLTRDRDAVAGLVGADWLGFLDSRWQGRSFTQSGQVLTVAPYAPAGSVTAADAIALTTLCIDWVKTQKPGH